MPIRHCILYILLCLAGWLAPHTGRSQDEITIVGAVRDERGQPVSNTIIINRRTRLGGFGRTDGTFTIRCLKTDTISVTSLGYFPRTISCADSAMREVYTFVTYLEQRTYRLPQVEIFAPRDLEKIQEDIRNLGYREEDYVLSGINAAQSPITFLYQQFSRREQSRREVARLENEDRKRGLLRELFRHYVDYDIISLSDEEFDEFISFMNVPDEFLIESSQYDFLLYVKERFTDYRTWKRRQGLMPGDYDYDRD
ncbi:MAG: carboxypeptidase-like regulatory domain-containing protein [Flavobacteriales bacterium]